MVDNDFFDFDKMKEETGVDPFADNTKKYDVDTRFYKLEKDENGSGAAVIRFLPDSERSMIQQMFKINTNITKNGKRRFVAEFSPTTIGGSDPFQEEWARLWNSGNKEDAKLYSRNIRYLTNIKVLRDPGNPDNEGKIFLFEMSGKMKDKVQSALNPSEQDLALGATKKEMFNPLKGNSFKLVARKGANGQINYDSSEIVSDVTSIYDSAEDALADIKENTFLLSDFLKEDAFLSYEELQRKFDWVHFRDVQNQEAPNAQTAQTAQTVQTVQTAQTSDNVEVSDGVQAETVPQDNSQDVPQEQSTKVDDLDDLLNSIT